MPVLSQVDCLLCMMTSWQPQHGVGVFWASLQVCRLVSNVLNAVHVAAKRAQTARMRTSVSRCKHVKECCYCLPGLSM